MAAEEAARVIEEARAALSASRAAMAVEAAPGVPFSPSKYPGVRKRSVPRDGTPVRVLVVPGMPVPVMMPEERMRPAVPIGVERPLPNGGAALAPDASALPYAIAGPVQATGGATGTGVKKASAEGRKADVDAAR